jgi:hypothetical protein
MTLTASRVSAPATALNLRKADVEKNIAIGVALVVIFEGNSGQLQRVECRGKPANKPEFVNTIFDAGANPRRIEAGGTAEFPHQVSFPGSDGAGSAPFVYLCTFLGTSAAGTSLTGSAEVNVPPDIFTVRNSCVSSPTSACFGNLEATATFTDPSGRQGTARVIPASVTPSTVAFYFDDPRQPEFSMSVTGCGPGAPPGSTYTITIRNETPWRYVVFLREVPPLLEAPAVFPYLGAPVACPR